MADAGSASSSTSAPGSRARTTRTRSPSPSRRRRRSSTSTTTRSCSATRAQLKGTTAPTPYIDADGRDTEKILEAAPETLDFREPAGVMLIAPLHCIPDEHDPRGLVRTLMEAVPWGSYLAISHPYEENHPSDETGQRQSEAAEMLSKAMVTLRVREEVAPFFAGLELVGPGAVPIQERRPDSEPRPLGRRLAIRHYHLQYVMTIFACALSRYGRGDVVVMYGKWSSCVASHRRPVSWRRLLRTLAEPRGRNHRVRGHRPAARRINAPGTPATGCWPTPQATAWPAPASAGRGRKKDSPRWP